MVRLHPFITILLLLMLGSNLGIGKKSSVVDYTNEVLVSVVLRRVSDIHYIRKLETKDIVDVWNEPARKDLKILMKVHKKDFKFLKNKLQKRNLKLEVENSNLQKAIIKEKETLSERYEPRTRTYNFFRYHSMEKIESFLKRSAKKHKDIYRLKVFGFTAEERPLYAVKISSTCLRNRNTSDPMKNIPSAKSKKMILIDCGIHAREWPTIAFCVYFINQLIVGYKGNDKAIRKVLTKYDFTIIPVFNPDGYIYSQTKDRFWRKNRSRNEQCYGVDLNRNFDTDDANTKPCSYQYGGKSPLSELESASFDRLLGRNSGRLKAYFSIHTYGQFWMMPWAKTTNSRPERYEEMARVGKIGAEAIRRKFGKEFSVGTASSLLYAVKGTTLDYVYEKYSVDYSFALELRDKGNSNFMLPLNEVMPLCLETTEGVLAAILAMK